MDVFRFSQNILFRTEQNRTEQQIGLEQIDFDNFCWFLKQDLEGASTNDLTGECEEGEQY